MQNIKDEINSIVETILEDYQNDREIDKVQLFDQPDTSAVIDLIDKLLTIIYPGFFRDAAYRFYNMDSRLTVLLEDVVYNLAKQIDISLKHKEEWESVDDVTRYEKAMKTTLSFLKQIPRIREFIDTDVEAFFVGDPAAYNKTEIILSYPGLYAVTVYRIAHELQKLQVPLIPRIMTEHAHSKTGIDIHPGASIGKYFFIDHGTGIVIGETTIIGEHVKVYQGVTIGALSTSGGQRLRGVKRHPTIESNVTIYAGASILGGETVIGEGSVIGSNVFITAPVPKGSKINYKLNK